MSRAKEVGLRKVIGSDRKQLVFQFLGESTLITLLSLPLGLFVYNFLISWFHTSFKMDYQIIIWDYPPLLGFILISTLLLGILSGIYPAFILSASQPIHVLRGIHHTSKKGVSIRRVLVVVQFVISVILIIFTIVMNRQYSYMQKIDLGFDKNNLLYASINKKGEDKIPIFRNALRENGYILETAITSVIPVGIGSGDFGYQLIPEGKTEETSIRVKLYPGSLNFIETLGIRLSSGRSFSEEFNEQDNCIISKSTADLLPWTDPIGKRVTVGKWTFTIIGIVENYHFANIYSRPSPTLMYYRREGSHILIRTAKTPDHTIYESIRTLWKSISPHVPITIASYKDRFQDKNRFGSENFVMFLGIITIFYSSIGILGLATFTIQTKTKEIAVRKVHGATTGMILRTLMIHFLGLVLLSSVIAIPLGYFLSHWFLSFGWIDSIDIGADIFILSILLSLLSAGIAVITQTTRAASKRNSAARG